MSAPDPPPASDIAIHAGGAEIFRVVAALYAEAFDEPWPEPSVRELMAGPGVQGLIASRAGTPCGFLLFRVVADEAELLALGIPPRLRRQGIGRRLTEAATRAVTGKASHFFLEVGDDNPAARQLYLSAGFIEVGRRPRYYRRADGRFVDASIMRLEITR